MTATTALTALTLDFVGFKVKSAKVDGVPARATRPSKRKVRVTPRTALAAGETVTVAITYQGKPDKPLDGSGWFWFEDGGALLATQPAGARMLFPSNDHPRDKATFTFDLRTPGGVRSVANGLPSKTKRTKNGWQRAVWRETGTFPTYAAVVAVGKFTIARQAGPNGLPIINALPRGDAPKLKRRLREQGRFVAVLESYFGPYPYSSIGAIVVPVSGDVDAMEAASRPTYPGLNWALRGASFKQTVAHEIAHQWLGNQVSFTSWRDIWLSEGFATYGELLWISHQRKVPIGSLFRRNSDVFGYERSMNWVPPGNPGPGRIFDTSVYNRGALTLDALRRTVGDDAFYAILRQWVDQYRGGNATTQDFSR